jgi:hypothetical protein
MGFVPVAYVLHTNRPFKTPLALNVNPVVHFAEPKGMIAVTIPTGSGDPVARAAIVREPGTGRFIVTAGRPRGSVYRPETRDRRKIRQALAMDGDYQSLVALGKMAQENVGLAIARGEPITSTWLLDKTMGRLPEAPLRIAFTGADFTTIDGVLATAAVVMEETAAGRLPLAQAEKFLNTCKAYGQLRMAEEIAKLEALLKETEGAIERGTAAKPETQLEPEQIPRWGRLPETLFPDTTHTNGHDKEEEELRKQLLE